MPGILPLFFCCMRASRTFPRLRLEDRELLASSTFCLISLTTSLVSLSIFVSCPSSPSSCREKERSNSIVLYWFLWIPCKCSLNKISSKQGWCWFYLLQLLFFLGYFDFQVFDGGTALTQCVGGCLKCLLGCVELCQSRVVAAKVDVKLGLGQVHTRPGLIYSLTELHQLFLFGLEKRERWEVSLEDEIFFRNNEKCLLSKVKVYNKLHTPLCPVASRWSPPSDSPSPP